MASAFTHAFAAVALGKTCDCIKMHWRFWFLAIVSANLPDADVIGFAFGIEYGDLLGHRGLSHSLLFALFWSFLVVSFGFKQFRRFSREWWKVLVFFFLVTASHGVLDALTNGGLGVAFFAPFDRTRYFFPWRPINVSPIGVTEFFSAWGSVVLLSEIKYVWLPLTALWLCVNLVRKLLRNSAKKGGDKGFLH
jgi:inner membrane protein